MAGVPTGENRGERGDKTPVCVLKFQLCAVLFRSDGQATALTNVDSYIYSCIKSFRYNPIRQKWRQDKVRIKMETKVGKKVEHYSRV